MYMMYQVILIKTLQEIQRIGATTGCHCHFTVRKNGQTIDPLTILKGGDKA